MVHCHVPKCHGLHAPTTGGRDKVYRWATATRCSVCDCTGFMCVEGCVLRKDMATRFHLKKHHSNKHRNIPAGAGAPDEQYPDDSNPFYMDDNVEDVAVTRVPRPVSYTHLTLPTICSV